MKIIRVDNFDRERPGLSDDVLIAENVPEQYVETIVAALNTNSLPDDDYVFMAFPDEYRPRKYVP